MARPPLFTTERAAEILHVSPATLVSWRSRGKGPAYVKIGRLVRYQPAEIDRYLDEQARGGSDG